MLEHGKVIILERYIGMSGRNSQVILAVFLYVIYVCDYEMFFGEYSIYMVDYGKWDCIVTDRPKADCIST